MTKKKSKVKSSVKKPAPKRSTTPTDRVIDRLGGNYEVASLLGVTEAAVSNYRAFGLFPAATFFVLRNALEARGFKANERLWNMKQRAA